MQYLSFRIRNFKGIKDTTISFETIAGAGVFPFVGLNESGKTTILEAIHSFAPDDATSELLGGEEKLGVPFKERVPRHLLSEFTGQVFVAATLSVNQEDLKAIRASLLTEFKIELDWERFPDKITISRAQCFENGDHTKNHFTVVDPIFWRDVGKRKWIKMANGKQYNQIREVIFRRVPRVAYFPTFVFEFPKTVFLTERGGMVDKFYRRAFQDILDYDGRGQTIEKDIVRRVRREEMVVTWTSFWPQWSLSDDKEKIQQVMDRASSAMSKLVFGRWNKIFGDETRGKEVLITYEILQGETEDVAGTKTKTNEHDVQIKFQIKDGTRRYDVNDRSLGFRWFFSFMLFTQFRVARSDTSAVPLVFLFDEPAANLHAAAQQKLIECFPEIAKGGHVLAYSTHSHYMIEPRWLEQTFIVSNRADTPAASMLDEISFDDESLDVKADTYRSFVNSHPNQSSYFQPILDRLDVVPSKFDMHKPSVVLEGRSDYYVLKYAEKLLGIKDIPLLPGLGAGTLGALASLQVGWGLEFVFLLDGDKKGIDEKKRYNVEFGVPLSRLATLSELVTGIKIIEDLLDDEARSIIKSALDLKTNLDKTNIKRFFQERLASDNTEGLGKNFEDRCKTILEQLRERLIPESQP